MAIRGHHAMDPSNTLLDCPYCTKRRLRDFQGLSIHISRTQHCRKACHHHLVCQYARRVAEDTSHNRAAAQTPHAVDGNVSNQGPDRDHSMDNFGPSPNTPTGSRDVDDEVGEPENSDRNGAMASADPDTGTSPNVTGTFHHRCHVNAAFTYGPRWQTQWEEMKAAADSERPYHPWSSQDEFELVEWLSTSKLSQAVIDHFLRLHVVMVGSSFIAQQTSLLMCLVDSACSIISDG